MIENASVLAPRVLRELVAAGSVSSAQVKAGDRGLVILFRAGMNERILGAARGGVRYFQSIDGAASVLQGYGIVQFEVDTSHWIPKTLIRAKTAEGQVEQVM
jgi:hypothetical protein